MDKIRVFTPPYDYDNGKNMTDIIPLRVFLGGTIDDGKSINWQSELIGELNSCDTVHPIIVYNPRRDEWPSSENHDEVTKQVNWELSHLEDADIIVMNVLGNSKSPISLMEIGLFAKDHKLIVFCEPSFYRFDNVKVVCDRYNIPLFETNDILIIKNEILKFANMHKNVRYITPNRYFSRKL
jgi:hypothetical protein